MWQNDRQKLGVGLLLAGVAAIPAAWILDASAETDSETITAAITTIVDDYKAENAAAVENAISAKSPNLRALVKPGLAVANFDNERVTDITVEVDGDQATARFRLNADFRLLKGTLGKARQPTRWELGYVREADGWKIETVTELDPFTGEVTDRWRRYVK